MMVIKLNENDIKTIVLASVKNILNEGAQDKKIKNAIKSCIPQEYHHFLEMKMQDLPKGIYPNYGEFNNLETYNNTRLIDVIRIEFLKFFNIKSSIPFINGLIRIAFNDLEWLYERKSRRVAVLKMDANYISKYMLNAFNEDLNGLNFEDLDAIVKQHRLKHKNNSLTTDNNKSDYTIVRINNVEDAKKYGKYCEWCVTQPKTSSSNFEKYTEHGQLFYFCLKNGFKNVKKEIGDNCPLDEYGLSMISVLIDEMGEPELVTTRWNHDYEGENNPELNTKEQLEQVLNVNFDSVFKSKLDL